MHVKYIQETNKTKQIFQLYNTYLFTRKRIYKDCTNWHHCRSEADRFVPEVGNYNPFF